MNGEQRLFSKKQRKQLHERAGGQCEGTGPEVGLPDGARCNRPLGKTWIADHITPHAVGGPTTLENAQALCVQCSVFKTSNGDVPRIAKNVRVEEKRTGVRRTSRPIPGSRASGIRKRMNGLVGRW